MRLPKLSTFALAAIFLFSLTLNSCSNDGSVSVIETSFEDEVPVAGNLVFTFNQNLIPDSLVETWDTIPLITFDPPIRGRFKWESPNTLVFSSMRKLPPATAYEANLTKALLQHMEGGSVNSDAIEFHTPYLALDRANAYWTVLDEANSEAVVRVDLEFNFAVDPAEAGGKVKINIDGKPESAQLITTEKGEKVSFFLPKLAMSDHDFPTTVIVEKGLNALGGSIPTDEDDETEMVIPSPYNLSILDYQAEHDGTEGRITFTVSQTVNEKDIKKYIKIDPPVSFEIEIINDGFAVVSEDFDAKKKYDITIAKGLEGLLGGTLKASFSEQMAFGKLRPSIEFANNKGVYLSGQGFKNLAVSIVSVPNVTIRISKVYENNIIAALRYGYNSSWSGGDYYDDDDEEYYWDYYEYDYYGTSNLGDVVYQKEIETRSLPRQGNRRLLNLDFEDRLQDYNGLYVVEVASTERYWLKTKKFISISDIGMIVKEGRDHVMVFTNSLKTADPLPNVEVSLIGNNNQVVKSVITGPDGIAEIQLDRNMAAGFKTALVTAKKDDDFNYLPYTRTRVGTSRFEIGGKRENQSGYDAFIYGDRDIYRPGEKINVSAIIRDFDWKSPGPIPVKMKLRAPDGKDFRTIKKVLNNQGSFETSVQLPASAKTGTYTVEVLSSNDILMNTQRIAVEEFVPDRIKVEVELDKEEMSSGESFTTSITATNLFGPPAAGRNYEVDMSIKRKYFNAKKYGSYNFTLQNLNRSYFDQELREGKTDENGQATEVFDVNPAYTHMGVLRADVFTTVFDETGRPVNRKKTIENIYTQDVFYGIKNMSYYNRLRSRVDIPLIAVDNDGKAMSAKAEMKLIKYEWKTVLSRSGRYYRYRSQKEEKILDIKSIDIAGENTKYSFTPELSGEYELRISAPEAMSYVSRKFYVYGYGYASSTSFEVNNEGHIDIELDKEEYEVGEKAQVLFKTPFAGKMLVTIESDEILRHFYLETDKKSAMYTINIPSEYVPNVYITATLFRAHKESDMPLTVAHGFQPVIVSDDGNKLPVTVTAPEKSRSKTTQEISIESKPNTTFTVAVVDEGILQLTNYQTPDPYGFFYQKRALGVSSYNLYPYLFPELSSKLTRPGGGGGDMDKRVNPLTNKRVKLVALWSGIMTTDGSGKAKYKIKVPQFSGDLRIMAVAYKDHAFGSTHVNMKVADPIVISSSIPRFLSPGDTLTMPVTLSNTTKKKANTKVRFKTKGIVDVLGSGTVTTSIPSNSEQRVVFKAVARKEVGHSKFTVSAEAMGETFTEVTDITIRPASPLQRVSGSGSVKSASSKKVTIGLSDFIPSSTSYKLSVSRSPLVQFADDLKYLVGYPHGCIEQTTSRAFPQIYYTDIAKEILKENDADPNPSQHVQAAIRKLMMMQVYNGGLTYWPSGGRVSWWSTAYAAHFLVEAKKAGYDVNEDFLNGVFRFMKERLKDKKTITYYYNRGMNKKIAPREVAYSLYVLALAGEQQRSVMNYYKSHPELLSLDSRYMLAGAYALTGDMARYAALLPRAFEGEEADKMTGGSFASAIRDEAIALNVLLEVDPDNQQVGEMARHVSKGLMTKRYLNTQERSFGFLAMGKFARLNAGKEVKATVKANGQTVGTYDGGDLKTFHKIEMESPNVTITTEGPGKLYYFWESEGISASGTYQEIDNHIKVRKTFYDRYGREIIGNTFEQNDLVVVRIKIQGLTRKYVRNVAISDILPAGFEIENPRISEIPGMDWVRNSARAEHMDIRDDRLNLYVDVNYNARSYYYVLRAVSLGTFQMGPVGADAMYDGEYHSYSGGGTITVREKQ